jgi:hypothetical protein
MTTPTHSGQTVADGVHIAHAYEFADAVARLALVATAADIGKIARQLDDDTWYILADTVPTWLQIDEGAISTAAVDAAGAIMHADISEAEGFVRKVGAEAYEAIKSNLSAIVAPIATDDSAAGYRVGSRWIDVSGGTEYVLIDSSPAAAVWLDTTGGAGSGWQDAGSVVRLSTTSDNVAIGNTTMLGSERLRVSGAVLIEGKLTVTGAIDPTSLRLDDVTLATYFEAAAGSIAGLSNANEGRIRYDETAQEWQVSENGGAYVPMLVSSGDHGGLTGLGDDDHLQYLLIDGTRAMTGNLDMDGFDINNLGPINGTRHYPNSGVDPVAPAPADGDIYYNTALQEEMRFDATRGKFLSVASFTVLMGRQGSTGNLQYLRGPGYQLMSASQGLAVHKGTIVYAAFTQAIATGSILQVQNNGAFVYNTVNNIVGMTAYDNLNNNIVAGQISARSVSGTITNCMATFTYKRRV